MTMEAMERMMSRLLRAEGSHLDTKDDLKQLREESRHNAERIDKVSKDAAELKKQMDEVRQNGSTAAGCSTTAASSTSGWRPI